MNQNRALPRGAIIPEQSPSQETLRDALYL